MVVLLQSHHQQDANSVTQKASPVASNTNAEIDMAGRTAALSRYLAALDSPPAIPDFSSVTTVPDLPSRISVSSSQDHNEFETSILSGNGAAYEGHKVVAMPSLGRKSVREVVSSREPPSPSVVRRSTTPGQQRSRSAGRAPQGKSSRDIVQDVYDRMGVSREDLGGDMEKFQSRYRAAAALSTNSDQPARGRSMDVATDGQRRARSLSRGRSVTGRWPPTREQDERELRATRDSALERANTNDSRIENATNNRHHSSHQQAKPSFVSIVDDSSRSSRPSSTPVAANSVSKKPSATTARKATDPLVSSVDDHAEDPSGSSSPSAVSSFSVKDRVTAITGGKSNRNFPKRSIPVQYAKRPHPPKIDIYEEIRKNSEEEGSNSHLAPEASALTPSPAAAAAADAAAELVRKNQFFRAHNGVRSPHANNKFDLCQNLPASKPPLEISGTDESGALADSSSIAVSSVSADEYLDRSPVNLPAKKEPVSRRWNGVVNSQRASTQPPASIKSTSSIASDHIDRLVEERLQVHLAELEARMEVQLERLETHLEGRMQNRLDQLEVKMDKIGAMLTSILSHRREA